jgi:2-phospho-L-lactate guanylyltransferase
MSDEPGLRGAAALIPVKAFARAKFRLSSVMDQHERAALARRMAEVVVRASFPLPVAVVCDDQEVAEWAQSLGARVLPEPGLGLNGAVNAGVAQLEADGFERLVVAHGDLPLATELAWVADFDGITLVPDRREDGTNVIGLPAGCGFRFAYGPGSFARHLEESRRIGVDVRVVRHPELGWDVDLPTDLVGTAD